MGLLGYTPWGLVLMEGYLSHCLLLNEDCLSEVYLTNFF